MYNIGVIGTGFVGSALLSHLEEKFQVSSYDLSDATEINLGYERVVSESNIIYVCVARAFHFGSTGRLWKRDVIN